MNALDLLLVVSVCTGTASGGPDRVYESPAPAGQVEVLSEGGGDTVIRFALDALDSEDVSIEGFGRGTRLSIPDGGISGIEGYPDLPVIRRMVRVPSTGDVRVDLLDQETSRLGVLRIPPLQPFPAHDGETPPFRISEELYTGSGLYPASPVIVESVCILRDIRVAWICYYPVSWDPSTGETTLNTEVTVRIHAGDGRGENELPRPFTGLTRSFLPLYDGVLGFPEREGADIIDGSYLFISSGEGLELAGALIDWKYRKGFEVFTATVPGIGSTPEAIDAWIENAYATWPNPPEYILIVGDGYVVPPPWYGGSFAADNMYGVLESGSVPSIHVGRLSGSDSDDLAYETWKIASHEMDPYEPSTSWFQSGISVGHVQFADNSYEYVEFMEYAGMDVTWFCDTGGIPPTIPGLAESLNEGCSMFGICGHGNLTTIVPPGFTNSNVEALMNGRRLGWWVLVACNTGEFDGEYCFSEALMGAGDAIETKGAIGVMSPTTGSPIGPADSLGKWIFEGRFVDGMSHMGAITDWGKARVYSYYGASGNSNNQMHMVFGCPELDIYNVSSPLPQIVCSHPDSILPGTQTFPVSVGGEPAAGVLVAVMIQDTVSGSWMESSYSDASGNVTFDIPSYTPGSPVCVTATGQNLHPYLSDGLVGIGGQEWNAPRASLSVGPVPCFGVLSIGFTLPESGRTVVSVYDMTGRVVATPVDDVLAAGDHSVVWGCSGQGAGSVPAGVYFCRLETASASISRRLVLLR